jgi:hypothetical protein
MRLGFEANASGSTLSATSRSHHGVNENLEWILSNNPQVTHAFETGRGEARKRKFKWSSNRVSGEVEKFNQNVAVSSVERSRLF